MSNMVVSTEITKKEKMPGKKLRITRSVWFYGLAPDGTYNSIKRVEDRISIVDR